MEVQDQRPRLKVACQAEIAAEITSEAKVTVSEVHFALKIPWILAFLHKIILVQR